MSALAAKRPVAVSSEPPKVAVIFNLDDPNESRINSAIQTFYGPDGCDRLRAIRRGTAKGCRMVWTLGSFHPDTPRAHVEWAVLHWAIDEISVRVQRCPDEETARVAFKLAGQPDPQWPGIKFPRK